MYQNRSSPRTATLPGLALARSTGTKNIPQAVAFAFRIPCSYPGRGTGAVAWHAPPGCSRSPRSIATKKLERVAKMMVNDLLCTQIKNTARQTFARIDAWVRCRHSNSRWYHTSGHPCISQCSATSALAVDAACFFCMLLTQHMRPRG
jgi:hypothetical protein